jgi:hypothetical protein
MAAKATVAEAASVCANLAPALSLSSAPVRLTELVPVIAVPGLTPRSPTMEVDPVLVTVDAPRTAKFAAGPSNDAAFAGELAKERVRIRAFTVKMRIKILSRC